MKLTMRLVAMMLTLLVIALLTLFILNQFSQNDLVHEIQESSTELSKAIQLSVEDLTSETDVSERLKDYMKEARGRGIDEINIISNEGEIINSSDPDKVGKRHDVSKMEKKLHVSRGRTLAGSVNPYELVVPVIVGDEQLGYVQVGLLLDNISDIQRTNFHKRLLATLLVFMVGTALVFYLASRYTSPIHRLVDGVKKVSEGDLSVTFPTGGLDEIGELSASFNEMVQQLREREHLEKRLYEAEHLSKVGQLASGIAHEIRNPLNYISLAVDHLKTEIALDNCRKREDLAGLLDKIKEEVRRVNYMVINFMNYGRPLKLRIAQVAYAELLEKVLPILHEKLEEQRILLETDIPTDLPPMQADPELIRNCIFNFVTNAADAMPEGGTVTLGASYDPALRNFALTFRDRGRGIDPEDMPRIFQPYFTTKEAGIGLGLAITERIIKEHGGSVAVESTPGEGTTFTVTLPQRELGNIHLTRGTN